MAKLKDEHLDALLASGLISTNLYDRAKSADNKEKAIKEVADETKSSPEYKKAEEDLRLAQNNAHTTPPAHAAYDWRKMELPPNIADWTGKAANQPTLPTTPPRQNVSLPPNATLEETIAASNNRPGTPPPQPVVAPNGVIIKPTPSQIAGFRAIEEEAKKAVPVSELAEGKPAEPAKEEPKPTLNVPKPSGGGVGNLYSGPTNFEKYLTPAEKDRKTQIVEEENRRAGITQQAGNIQMQEDQQLAEIEQRRALEYKAMIDLQVKQREIEQAEIKKNTDKLWADSEKISNTKLDPDRAWSRGLFGSNTTANKVLAGIGMFFGAAGTKKGGANPVVQQIQDSIDKDIKMQEFDIKNSQQGVESRKGLLQERIKQFGNNELARAAAKKDYLDVVENQIKAVVAGNASDKTRTKMDELLASLDEARTKTLNEFNMLNDQRARQIAAQQAAAQASANSKLYEEYKARRDYTFKVNEERIKAGLPPLSPEQATGVKAYDQQPSGKDAMENIISLNRDPATGQVLQQPKLFKAKSGDDAKKIKEAQEAYDKLMVNTQNIQDLRTKYGGGTVSREAVAVAKVYRQNIVGAVKKLDELGALDKGVENYVEPLIPSDPMEYSPLGSTDAQIEAFKKGIEQDFQSKLKTRLSPASVTALGKSPEQVGGTKNTK